MLENILLAFSGIWSHKLRSLLTMLGIIIGISAIIAIVSTIQGTSNQIKENLIGAGNNTVKVVLNQGDYAYDTQWGEKLDGVPQISETTKKQITDIEEVKSASVYQQRQYVDNVSYGKHMYNGQMLGVDQDYFKVSNLVPVKGSLFAPKEYSDFSKVVVLDELAAQTLFNTQDPIGQKIMVGQEPFTVVGVVKVNSLFKPKINNFMEWMTFNQQNSGSLFIPIKSWPVIYKFDEPQSMLVQANQTDSMPQAGKKTADILNQTLTVKPETKVAYKSENLLEQVQRLQELANATNEQLVWIASISLLVGGIGVMNIMLVSVTERTKEIGLKKAIGAKKSHILSQFLTEAAVLTLVGGLIGVIGGFGLSQLISQIGGTPTAISIPIIIISVVFSAVIGIIFGLLPAIKASNLSPIDALRRE